MKLFNKRETLVQNIAFMGLMAAINAIFALITYFLPIGGLVLMLLLPLTSVLVVTYCNPKYIPIYVLATLGVSIAVTAMDFSSTILFVLPSLIAGTTLGILRKLRFPIALNLFVVSLINMGFAYVSVFFIKLVTNVDMIDVILKIFNLTRNENINVIMPSIVFVYALAQTVLANIFVSVVGNNLLEDDQPKFTLGLIVPISGFFASLVSLVVGLFFKDPAYLFLIFSIYWGCFAGYQIFLNKNKLSFIIGGVLLILSIFGFAIFYSKMLEGTQLLLVNFFSSSVCICCLVNNFLLLKSHTTNTINTEDK